MNPLRPNKNVQRQEELRKAGIDEDHAARIAGTSQDIAGAARKQSPNSNQWARKTDENSEHVKKDAGSAKPHKS